VPQPHGQDPKLITAILWTSEVPLQLSSLFQSDPLPAGPALGLINILLGTTYANGSIEAKIGASTGIVFNQPGALDFLASMVTEDRYVNAFSIMHHLTIIIIFIIIILIYSSSCSMMTLLSQCGSNVTTYESLSDFILAVRSHPTVGLTGKHTVSNVDMRLLAFNEGALIYCKCPNVLPFGDRTCALRISEVTEQEDGRLCYVCPAGHQTVLANAQSDPLPVLFGCPAELLQESTSITLRAFITRAGLTSMTGHSLESFSDLDPSEQVRIKQACEHCMYKVTATIDFASNGRTIFVESALPIRD
jgi:hypothetical protein